MALQTEASSFWGNSLLKFYIPLDYLLKITGPKQWTKEMCTICWPETGPHASNVYYSLKKHIWVSRKLHCFIKEN